MLKFQRGFIDLLLPKIRIPVLPPLDEETDEETDLGALSVEEILLRGRSNLLECGGVPRQIPTDNVQPVR